MALFGWLEQRIAESFTSFLQVELLLASHAWDGDLI